MNAAETLTLCRYVKAVCPQQQMDEFTPDAWCDLLGDLRFEDCREAARNLGRTQHFIDPADIRKEVHRIRARRIEDHPPIDPPRHDMTEGQYRNWLIASRRRIADGDIITQPALESRPTTGLRELVAQLDGRDA